MGWLRLGGGKREGIREMWVKFGSLEVQTGMGNSFIYENFGNAKSWRPGDVPSLL